MINYTTGFIVKNTYEKIYSATLSSRQAIDNSVSNYSKLENMSLVQRKYSGKVSQESVCGAVFRCHVRDFSEAYVIQS